jgi:hypothetical protein
VLSFLATFVRHVRHAFEMQHPKAIGDRTTLMVMLALMEDGFEVYLPFGENTRCDLISYDGHRLSRVQCKTGRLRNGGVLFAPCSTYGHHPNPKIRTRTYLGEIDEFGVFCPETRAVYMIPIADVAAATRATLRVSPCRNAQRKRVRYAAEYELLKIDVY